MMKTGR